MKLSNLKNISTQELSSVLDVKGREALLERFSTLGLPSKKSEEYLAGRTDSNKVVIFPYDSSIKVGDYVKTKVYKTTSATLFGDYLETIDQINYDVSNTA